MIHNTHISQFIPPTAFHFSTATMTQVAGSVAGTIAMNRAAAAQTSLITVPILIPSNSIALQGAKLASIEIDYEIFTAEPTSITATVKKVTRGIEGAVAVVTEQTFTQSPAAAASKTVDQHKLVLTITTPIWLDNDEYVLAQLSLVAGATDTAHFLGAVANFTLRM
jgi:hypothetical protein